MINNLCKIAAYIGVGYDICKQDDEVPDKIKQEFAKHVTEFGLNYPTKEEYDYRLSIFAQKHVFIAKKNSENGSFRLGHNLFSSWTDEEYKKLLGYKKPKHFLMAT